MRFHATNLTVSVALIMATVFLAGVRMRKPLENNWLLFYWLALTFGVFASPYDLADRRMILVGLAAGLLLRFEFMNSLFTAFVRTVELFVMAYILYCGWIVVTTY